MEVPRSKEALPDLKFARSRSRNRLIASGQWQFVVSLVACLALLIPLVFTKNLHAASGEQQTGTVDEIVSLDFRDVPLSQVVDTLVYQRNLNIVAPPGLEERVTVKLVKVPWKTALTTILRNYGYGFVETENILRVDKLENLNKDSVLKSYALKHLDRSGVTQYIRPQVSASGTTQVVETPEDRGRIDRKLLVTDTPVNQGRVQKALDEYDQPKLVSTDVEGPAADGTLSVEFSQAPVDRAIAALASRMKLSVAWEGLPSGTVNLFVRHLSMDRLLDLILRPLGYSYEWDAELIRIGPKDSFLACKITRTFTLEYANAVDLVPVIRNRLSKEGKIDLVTNNYGTGTGGGGGSGSKGSVGGGGGGGGTSATICTVFTITDTPAILRDVADLIKVIDVPPRQVLIEVQLVEMTLSDKDTLGIQWNLAVNGSGSSQQVAFPLNDAPPTAGSPSFTFGVVSFANLSYLLQLLSSRDRIHTLSSPTIATLDRQVANILVGEKFPIVSETINALTGQRTLSADRYEDIGIRLRVVPQIFGKEYINLTIRPTVSSRGQLVSNQYPVIQTREVETQLMVRRGHTAVIGGLMQDRKENIRTGIPAFMDLRVLGNLFGQKQKTRDKSELMIFVTPRVLSEERSTMPERPAPVRPSKNKSLLPKAQTRAAAKR